MKKTEQKQHLIDMMNDDEELGIYGEVHGKQGISLTSDYIQNIGKEIQPEQIWNKEKMEGIKKLIQDHKQETLEEAAKDFANNSAVTNYEEGINVGKYQGFIRGAKWLQERSYSEEEVIHIVQRLMYDVHCGDITDTDFIVDFKISPIKWFEQFKKK